MTISGDNVVPIERIDVSAYTVTTAFTTKEALALAAIFASESGGTWFEEPVPSDDLEGLRLIRDRAPVGMDSLLGNTVTICGTSSTCLRRVQLMCCKLTRHVAQGSPVSCAWDR